VEDGTTLEQTMNRENGEPKILNRNLEYWN